MQERREQMAERLRSAEQARDLLTKLERRLKKEDGPELERLLSQLDQSGQPLPEADRIRWFIESAAGSGRAGRDRGEPVPLRHRGRDLDAPRLPRSRDHLSPGPGGGAPRRPWPEASLPKAHFPDQLDTSPQTSVSSRCLPPGGRACRGGSASSTREQASTPTFRKRALMVPRSHTVA